MAAWPPKIKVQPTGLGIYDDDGGKRWRREAAILLLLGFGEWECNGKVYCLAGKYGTLGRVPLRG